MVVKVDSPPVARIPDKFMVDDEIREYMISRDAIIDQLYRRTGGNDDIISSNQDFADAQDSKRFGELRQLTKKVNQIALALSDLESKINMLMCKKSSNEEYYSVESQINAIKRKLHELENTVN